MLVCLTLWYVKLRLNRCFHILVKSGPILLIFGILIPRTIKCNVISVASQLLSPKNVSMSLNIILYLSIYYIYYIYILLIQFWHSTHVNVRLSYHFKALLFLHGVILVTVLFRLWNGGFSEYSRTSPEFSELSETLSASLYSAKSKHFLLWIQEFLVEQQ